MCDTIQEIEISKKIFLSAKTVVEFMDLWSKFYENKICIPTYLSKFIGAGDNPEASEELGKKFKEISKRGVLAIDSQVGIPGSQKQYITGYMSTNLADVVIPELNRYSGIVAFYGPIVEMDTTDGLYVTYDVDDEEKEEGAKIKKMLGEPFTSIRGADTYSFADIREWMSRPVKKKTKKDKYSHFVIIDPCFSDPSEYIFDKLLEVLRGI